jgi:metallophosphoesterase superfamily enzyme
MPIPRLKSGLEDAFRGCQRVRSGRILARAKLTVLEGNHDNAVLRMLSSCAPSMVVGFYQIAKVLPEHHAAKVADE